MVSSSTRQGFYILFVIILAFINDWLKWFSIGEYLVIAALVMIVIKLTDLEDAIRGKI